MQITLKTWTETLFAFSPSLCFFSQSKENPTVVIWHLVRRKKPTAVSLSLKINTRQRKCRRKGDIHFQGWIQESFAQSSPGHSTPQLQHRVFLPVCTGTVLPGYIQNNPLEREKFLVLKWNRNWAALPGLSHLIHLSCKTTTSQCDLKAPVPAHRPSRIQ